MPRACRSANERWKVSFATLLCGLLVCSPVDAFMTMHDDDDDDDISVRCSRESQFVGPNNFSFVDPIVMFPSKEQFCNSDPNMKGKVIWNPFSKLIATLDERDPCGSISSFEVGLLAKIADSGCLAFVTDVPAYLLGFLWTDDLGLSKLQTEITAAILACERSESLFKMLEHENVTTISGLPKPGSDVMFNISLLEPDDNEWQLMWNSWWYGAIFRWFFGMLFLFLSYLATKFCYRHWKNKIARKGVTNPIPMIVLADNAITLFILSVVFLYDGWWSVGNMNSRNRHALMMLLQGQYLGTTCLVGVLWIDTREQIEAARVGSTFRVRDQSNGTLAFLAFAFFVIDTSAIFFTVGFGFFRVSKYVLIMYMVSQLAASYYCITQSLAMARAILKIIPQSNGGRDRGVSAVVRFMVKMAKWMSICSIFMLVYMALLPIVAVDHVIQSPTGWLWTWFFLILARAGESFGQIMMCKPAKVPVPLGLVAKPRKRRRRSIFFGEAIVQPEPPQYSSTAGDKGSVLSIYYHRMNYPMFGSDQMA